jgi:hypothetical protein
LPWLPCRRAVATTPADPSHRVIRGAWGALCMRRRRPSHDVRRVGVRDFTFEACSAFTAVTARRLAESRQRDSLRRELRPIRYLLGRPDCYRVEQPTCPDGTFTRWKTTPSRRTDGFEFNLKTGQGHVLELLNAEIAHREDPQWLAGLLAIAHEHSRWQLALGARFFVTLFLDRGSVLIGTEYEMLSVPAPFWAAARHGDPFAPVRPAS